jgi:hypothetical protein
LDLLRAFVNISSEDSWELFIGWLLAAARPGVPAPVLILHGEQGSAKSTAARVARELIDPSAVPLRAAPANLLDLMVGATSSWVVAYDNLSHLQPWLSDALCRLSTGGGLSKRELYTDEDEVLLDAQRPVVINGIAEIATRSDLLDRAVMLELGAIEDDKRVAEEMFWVNFRAEHPKILGALLDVIVAAMANVGAVRLDRLPRMADFATWITAAEPALRWEEGSFMKAYAANRGQSHELAVDASIVGPLLRQVAERGFDGTSSELLQLLATKADERTLKSKDWPTNARSLSAVLTRLAPDLRRLGYVVDRGGGRKRRNIELKRAGI